MASRKAIYGTLEELQDDLEIWLQEYIEHRPHSGPVVLRQPADANAHRQCAVGEGETLSCERRMVYELKGATMSLDFLRVIVVVGFSILIAACNSSEGGNSPAPSMVLAPTYYVDPTCGVNGDGTTTTCGIHGPFNSWNNVSPWAAGNTYAGKGGTSETFTTYSIQASGTAGNPITITSYGTGQFTFASTTEIGRAHV